MCVKYRMSDIKYNDNKKFIPVSAFETCLLTAKTRKDIEREYKGRENGAYYLDKFQKHLESIGLSLKRYIKEVLLEEWPKCPISQEEVGFVARGAGVTFSSFKKGKLSKELCPAFKLGCEKLSRERAGKGNPMFGKESWNKGLTSETDNRVKLAAEKRKGRIVRESTKEKQKLARKNHPLKARHTQKHSEDAKQKCREGTAKGWANGRFNRKTSIEHKMEDLLISLSLKENFIFQYQHKYFTLDFAFPEAKVGIECQGTFFHIDPRIYPNGPKTEIQKRNQGRDERKRAFFEEEGWTIIESWEIEINNGQFKQNILCALQKSNLLQK